MPAHAESSLGRPAHSTAESSHGRPIAYHGALDERSVLALLANYVSNNQLIESLRSVLAATQTKIDDATSSSLGLMKDQHDATSSSLRLMKDQLTDAAFALAEKLSLLESSMGLLEQRLSDALPVRSSSPADPEPLSNLDSAHASPSPLQQTFTKDAVRNPSQKQLERLVQHLNQGTLDENEFVNVFSSRSQRKAKAKATNCMSRSIVSDELHVKKYCFRRTPPSIDHLGARRLGTRTHGFDGCHGSDEFDGAQVRLECAPACSQLGVSPQVGSCGAADGSPAEPALGTTEHIAPRTSM